MEQFVIDQLEVPFSDPIVEHRLTPLSWRS